jgi:hypothetical protein
VSEATERERAAEERCAEAAAELAEARAELSHRIGHMEESGRRADVTLAIERDRARIHAESAAEARRHADTRMREEWARERADLRARLAEAATQMRDMQSAMQSAGVGRVFVPGVDKLAGTVARTGKARDEKEEEGRALHASQLQGEHTRAGGVLSQLHRHQYVLAGTADLEQQLQTAVRDRNTLQERLQDAEEAAEKSNRAKIQANTLLRNIIALFGQLEVEMRSRFTKMDQEQAQEREEQSRAAEDERKHRKRLELELRDVRTVGFGAFCFFVLGSCQIPSDSLFVLLFVFCC